MSRSATFSVFATTCLICTVALAGCSSSFSPQPGSTPSAVASIVSGKVIGGQNPVSGATVSVYQVGTSGYGMGSAQLGTSVLTGTDGTFSFPANNYTCPYSNTPTYIVATGGDPGAGTNANLALMAVLGSCSDGKNASIEINEVTTAATVTAVGQFMNTALGAGVTPSIGGTCTGCADGVYNRGLVNAMTVTYPQLVTASGDAVEGSAAGTMTITTEDTKLNSFANVLASCVNSRGATSTTETTTTCGRLFSDVNEPGATPRPADTVQAGLMMALYPFFNVKAVYDLASSESPFSGLPKAPNDWTIGISYTTTTLGLGVQQHTSSNLDIDANGNVWFPSNKTGAVGLAYFNPSTTTFSGAMGAAGLLYPQYLSIDTSAAPVVWMTDLESSLVVGVGVGTGGVTNLTGTYTTGGPIAVDGFDSISVAGGIGGSYKPYFIDTTRASVTAPDGGNAFTGLPTALAVPLPSHYVYPGLSGTAESSSMGCSSEGFDPSGDTELLAQTGTVSCDSGGGVQEYVAAEGITLVFVTDATDNQVYDDYTDAYNSYPGLAQPEGVATDGAANLWVANAANASVSLIQVGFGTDARGFATLVTSAPDANAYQHGDTSGKTMIAPYGIGVDGSGNVWVSNAGCVSTSSKSCQADSFTLSEMVGAAAPATTPVAAEGDGVHKPTN